MLNISVNKLLQVLFVDYDSFIPVFLITQGKKIQTKLLCLRYI